MRRATAVAFLAAILGGCVSSSQYQKGYDSAYAQLERVDNARKAGRERVDIDPYWKGVFAAINVKAAQWELESALKKFTDAVQKMRSDRASEPSPVIENEAEKAAAERRHRQAGSAP